MTENATPVRAAAVPDGAALEPVREHERIIALDVLRGFALFGIFWVNIQLFARPFVWFVQPIGGDEASTVEVVAWGVIKALFEFKFITIFSLLFGIGMSMQLMRARERGRKFAGMYLRRLFVLGIFGAIHATLFWYGDILFLYAMAGLMLLVMSCLSPRGLMIAAAIMFFTVGVLMAGLTAVQIALVQSGDSEGIVIVLGDDEPAAAPVETVDAPGGETEMPPGDDTSDDAAPEGAPVDAETGLADAESGDDDAGDADDEPEDLMVKYSPEVMREAPFKTAFMAFFADQNLMFSDHWAELERSAFRDGPLMSATAVRTVTWGFIILQSIFSLVWRTLAVFLFGAAVMQLGFFSADNARWHRRFCIVGLLVGLPGEIAVPLIEHGSAFGASWRWGIAQTIHYFSSVFLAMGYVGAVMLLVRSRLGARIGAAFACVGRLALSNYLLQTLVATAVMYWWGLGRFDTFGRPAMILFVIGVFIAQIGLSALWLRRFQTGPMEWLWRSLTYLRPQPLLKPRSPEGDRA
jgi:uncharacterized membrane protein YeiB